MIGHGPRAWQDTHLLLHYTKSPEIVASILKNGFMLVPNRRHLINALLDNKDGFQRREPQQFGMVSFTELRRDDAAEHRESFGDYGIAVRWEWAQCHDAQRVIYIGDGPVFRAFAWLFQYGRQELERACPEPVTEAHLTNRAVAALYDQVYAKLLTLYEYMEPERNSSQVEWRIVNRLPYHHDLADWDRLLKELLSYASKGIDTIKLTPSDVDFLVCPRRCVRQLRAALPEGFRDVPVVPCGGRKSLWVALRALIIYTEGVVRRGGTIVIPPSQPPADGPVIRRSRNLTGVYDLPPIKTLNGLAVNTDKVLEAVSCNIQYEPDGADTILSLDMPVTEAVRLLTYLMEMTKHPTIRRHLELIAQRESAQRKGAHAPATDARSTSRA